MLAVAQAVHMPLVERFITSAATAYFEARVKFPECGMVVDATVQDRGRPVGRWDEAKKYFSGKHSLYCLKSQVITDRQGAAILVAAGVKGAVHDFLLFRQHVTEVEELVARHAGEPVHLLADLGYLGDPRSGSVVLVRPTRKPPRKELPPEQRRMNAAIASERVIVENFFGRLRAKFQIMDERWAMNEDFYPVVFEICCALVNFDIRSPGGSPLRAEESQFYLKALTRSIEKAKRTEGRVVEEEVRSRERSVDPDEHPIEYSDSDGLPEEDDA
jgi:hypothetical protein